MGFTVLHNPLHFDIYNDLGTTTPQDYASLFAQVAKGTLVGAEASAEMVAIFRESGRYPCVGPVSGTWLQH